MKDDPSQSNLSRRSFLSLVSSATMVAGLVAAYGTLLSFLGRFLYPLNSRQRSWTFLTHVGRLSRGESLLYEAPDGSTITLARRGEDSRAEDFIALSSTCPHLGCRVHWEPHNERFFCPCHNGVFDPEGRAVSGPPADAGQSLPRYPLKVDGDVLLIEIPTGRLARTDRVQAPPRRG